MNGQDPTAGSWVAAAAQRSGIAIPDGELHRVAEHLVLLLTLAATVKDALPEPAPVYPP